MLKLIIGRVPVSREGDGISYGSFSELRISLPVTLSGSK